MFGASLRKLRLRNRQFGRPLDRQAHLFRNLQGNQGQLYQDRRGRPPQAQVLPDMLRHPSSNIVRSIPLPILVDQYLIQIADLQEIVLVRQAHRVLHLIPMGQPM